MLPSPSLLLEDLRRERSRAGTEEQNKPINHACFTPAAVCSLSRLHCAEPEGLHIKAGTSWLPGPPQHPDGSALPMSCCLHSLPAGMQRCSLLQVQHKMPGATSAAERIWDSITASLGWEHHPLTGMREMRRPHTWMKSQSQPKPVLEHLSNCTKPMEPQGWHSLLPQCSSCYPHTALFSAVPSMTHDRRFPQAAALALL